MKFKLITIILLSFSLTACGDNNTKISTVAVKDSPSWKRERICEQVDSEPYPFDFKYIFNENIKNSQQFSREITNEERDQFYNFIKDHMDAVYLGETERFNRKRPEPKFNPTERYQREQKIKILLDECVALVGPESDDKDHKLDLQKGVFTRVPLVTNDQEYEHRIQHHYLSGRMQKCERAVYPYTDQYIGARATPCSGPYNLSDFEYQNPIKDPQAKAKRSILEKKYEVIYLNVRGAGLLRDLAYTYYPKSFLRQHADQTGLTKYIQAEEKKAGHSLKHDELAKEYFGSYEKWMSSLDKFLDQKIIDMKIGI